MAWPLAQQENPHVCPSHLNLGRFEMFSWKIRFVVAAALALSLAGGDFDWLRSLGW